MNRQFDGDHVAKHVDAVQLTMDIGEIRADADHKVAELIAPIALQAERFYAGVAQVDHAVIGEERDEPGDVHDAALRRLVRLPDDCFIVVRDLALLIRVALIRLRACGTEDSELRRSNADCRKTKECAPLKIAFFEHMSFSH